MHHNIIESALFAAALMLAANLSFAADAKPEARGAAADAAKAAVTGTKQKKNAAPKVKLVDINGAKKEELKTLPGIGDAEADKIIAGRPYGSKSHLETRNILSKERYEGLKKRVVARQK